MAASSCAAAAGGATTAMPGKRMGMGASPALSCLLLLVLAGMATPAAVAAVYKVGDSAGWTIIGNVNYTAWAVSKTFHVGDTLVFEYNKQFHNVLEVSKAGYHACNPQSPLATHTTGNDSITLKRAGHHFFLCGVPDHCALGQKVDIRIPKRVSTATAPAVAPSRFPLPPMPSPHALRRARRIHRRGPGPAEGWSPRPAAGWALALVAVAIAAAAVDLS